MKNGLKFMMSLLVMLMVAVPASSGNASKKASVKKIVLTADNTISLNDEINGESVAAVITKAKKLGDVSVLDKVSQKKQGCINLFLRTPGGEIQTGLEMLEALNGLDRCVNTITMFAASMGFQTAQQLGKRYIVQNGVLMSHRARGGFEGEFGGQKPSQIDSRKGFWEQRIQEMDEKTVERTNGKQTLASYQAAYVPELWLTGRQAVEQGYVDEVVEVKCDESLKGVTTHSVNFMGIINIDYDLDNCPLNSTPMNVRIGRILTNKGMMSMDDFMAKNGGFGSPCLVASGVDANKVCAMNTDLTLERVSSLKSQFRNYYMDIKNRTIPFKF